jgi:hypothetical protein
MHRTRRSTFAAVALVVGLALSAVGVGLFEFASATDARALATGGTEATSNTTNNTTATNCSHPDHPPAPPPPASARSGGMGEQLLEQQLGERDRHAASPAPSSTAPRGMRGGGTRPGTGPVTRPESGSAAGPARDPGRPHPRAPP